MKTRLYVTVRAYEKPDTPLFRDLPKLAFPVCAGTTAATYVEVASIDDCPIRSKVECVIVVLEPKVTFKVYLSRIYIHTSFEETLVKLYTAGWSRVREGDE